MAKKARAAPAQNLAEPDPLAIAVERLADAVTVLRDAIDAIREDFSWVTRNGLPVQPMEHVIVKRMAKDPLASDWNEQLETIHLQSPPPSSTVDPDVIQKLADGLTSAFEGIAQGQLEIVLTALDGVRTETLAVIGKQSCRALSPKEQPTKSPEIPEPSAGDSASVARTKPRRGQLF